MALIEKEVVITTRHGRMPAFTACPDTSTRVPGIIIYMDAPGYREELCNMARRVAKNGYFCVLPDMYYRYGVIRFDTPRRTDAMSTLIKAAWTSLTNAEMTDDTAAILAYLDAQDAVRPGAMGCIGFCMGGRPATMAAARFPHRIKASASLYGVHLVTDKEDSPHRFVDRIGGELYYGFAEHDQSVPPNVIPEFRAALDKAGAKYTLEVFPGTQHGFSFPERPSYAPLASEQAWDKVFALWERNLK